MDQSDIISRSHTYSFCKEGDLVQVPVLSPNDLIKYAKRELRLTYLDEDLAKWNFMMDEQGKAFEVRLWKPDCEVVPSVEVYEYFSDGFFGSTATFVAWVAKYNPKGYFASIPRSEKLFRRDGRLYATSYVHDDTRRKLTLGHDVRRSWRDHWTFVAFREIR